MELALFVYLAGLTNSLIVFSALIAVVSGIALIVYSIYSMGVNIEISGHHRYQKHRYQKRWVIGWILFVGLASLIPSERTLWLMAGAYGTQKVVQSEVGADVLEIINLKIKKELADMKKESGK